MSSQLTGLQRNTQDKFYTKSNIVNDVINDIKAHITELNNTSDSVLNVVIEPSAGNGSFISAIKLLHIKKAYYYDILPENDEIIKQDYLKLDINKLGTELSELGNYKIHIIGNPPFGRQSSTALKFIKFSCRFADTISFILPKSFKKESMQNKIPLNFQLIFQRDLPNNSFLVDNIEYDVPCVFQIWCKSDNYRIKKDKLKECGYSFINYKKSNNIEVDATIAFRRVGVYAGTIYTSELSKKSYQSHYFIKFDINDEHKDAIIEKLKLIQFNESENTVGPKSISKQELINKYNVVFKNYIN